MKRSRSSSRPASPSSVPHLVSCHSDSPSSSSSSSSLSAASSVPIASSSAPTAVVAASSSSPPFSSPPPSSSSAVSSSSPSPSVLGPLETRLFKAKGDAYRKLTAAIVADLRLQPDEDAARGHSLLRNLERLYRLHERTHDLELADSADPDCVVTTLHMALSLAAHIERRPDARHRESHVLTDLLPEPTAVPSED